MTRPNSIILISIVAAVVITASFWGSFSSRKQSNAGGFTLIENSTAKLMLKERDVVLLDVRTATEFQSHHLPQAINIPVEELPSRIEQLYPYKDKKLLVYCRTQNRSKKAGALLSANGFEQVFVVNGGVSAWSGGD